MSIRNRIENLERIARVNDRKVKIFSWRDWEVNMTESEQAEAGENSIVIVNIPTLDDCLEYGDRIDLANDIKSAYGGIAGEKWKDKDNGQ